MFFSKLPYGVSGEYTVSPKPCSLAVDEMKEEGLLEEVEINFEPQLKILVNKRWKADSDSIADSAPVSIRGRMTISF